MRFYKSPVFFSFCIGLGVLFVNLLGAYISIGSWHEEARRLACQDLTSLARSGLAVLYSDLSSQVRLLESWAQLELPGALPVAGESPEAMLARLNESGKFQALGIREAADGPAQALTLGAGPSPAEEETGRQMRAALLQETWMMDSLAAARTQVTGPVEWRGTWVMRFATPIRRRSDPAAPPAVLFAVADWTKVVERTRGLLQRGDPESSGDLLFYVFSTKHVLAGRDVPPMTPLENVDLQLLRQPNTIYPDPVSIRNEEYVGGAATAQGMTLDTISPAVAMHDWGVAVFRSSRVTFARVYEASSADRAFSFAVGLGIFAFLLVAIRWRFIAPTTSILRFIEQIGEGAMNERLLVTSGLEYETLAGSINRMLDTIQEKTRRLREMSRQEQELEAATIRERQRSEVDKILGLHIDAIEQVAQGNLNVEFVETGPGDLPILGRRLNYMVRQMDRLLGEIHSAVEQLGITTGGILGTVRKQYENFQVQGHSLNRTSKSVEGLSRGSQSTSEQAQKVVEKAGDTARQFREGEKHIQESLISMQNITKTAVSSHESMKELAERLDKVDDILASVNEIAEQSKLLSLNAAIEAARAEEYGKGFAVVAVEVRNLAVQSREATAQIKSIVRDIRDASSRVVEALNQGMGEVEKGKQLMDHIRFQQGQHRAALDDSLQLAHRVRVGSTQQYQSLEEISGSMRDNVSRMDQNLDGSKDIEQRMQELSRLAESLKRTAAVFTRSIQRASGGHSGSSIEADHTDMIGG